MFIATIYSHDGPKKLIFPELDDNSKKYSENFVVDCIEGLFNLYPKCYHGYCLMDDRGDFYVLWKFLTITQKENYYKKFGNTPLIVILTENVKSVLGITEVHQNILN